MHVFEVGPTATIAGETCLPLQGTTQGFKHIEFAANQTQPPLEQNVTETILKSVAAQKFFFGIEVSASKIANIDALDYTRFDKLLPIFTSIIWVGNLNWDVEPIECVGALQLAARLAERMHVISHFTAYRLSRERLEQFLALGRRNMLALRGDSYDEDQTYKRCSDLVRDVRRLRGDTISIGVAGYPDVHPSAESRKQDIEMLLKKVRAGADYIITQFCFSTQTLIEFVRDCRAAGINVPIIVGVIVPHSLNTIKMINKVAYVPIDEQELASLKDLKPRDFRAYMVQRAAQHIIDVMSADIGIYGFQFYTLNRLAAVHEILDILRTKGIIKDDADAGGDAKSQ